MHTTQKSQRAFTLVELSIVLVVIGLLVGGVLVGRDLVRAAEVRAQVSQLQEIQSQFAAFRLKYGCLPGDCAYARTMFGSQYTGKSIANGDGDQLVRSTLGLGAPYQSGECVLGQPEGSELPQVFLQLSAAGMSKFNGDGFSGVQGTGFPDQRSDPTTSLFVTCLQGPTNLNYPLNPDLSLGNLIVLGAYPNAISRIVYSTWMVTLTGNTISPIGISVDVVGKIDGKIDNGLPASGVFGVVGALGTSNNGGVACLHSSNTTYPPAPSGCNATAGYRLGQ